ncbi:hypothetical protein DRP07_02200 [Archaeoglobales archaeon]|nr:MAG: hypothetical protein DRP07_02200 [Archaeoglobales archaeon]
MGYTHYWYRPKKIPKKTFSAIVEDFKKVAEAIESMGIKLRGGDGTGEPEISNDAVVFNGDALCGHPKRDLIIPWPTEEAGGVVLSKAKDPREGVWFAGHLIKARTCDGDCSYETFWFPRVDEDGMVIGKIAYYDASGRPVYNDSRKVGKVFGFCKTAYRPYDIAVTAFLIIAKHHLGDKIIISSDGEIQHWYDAMHICQDVLGYGEDFEPDWYCGKE